MTEAGPASEIVQWVIGFQSRSGYLDLLALVPCGMVFERCSCILHFATNLFWVFVSFLSGMLTSTFHSSLVGSVGLWQSSRDFAVHSAIGYKWAQDRVSCLKCTILVAGCPAAKNLM
jgi:hypothetical protein